MVEMMPKQLAKKPNNAGEKLVFEALEQIVGHDDWVAIHSLKQTKVFANIEAETDFVIFVPKKGIVIVEVKGAKAVEVEGEDWSFEGGPPEAKNKNPFKQIDNARRSIRRELKQHGYEVDGIPIARLVWFTRIGPAGFMQGNTGMSFTLDEVAFQNDLQKPAQAIIKTLDAHLKNYAGSDNIKLDPKLLDAELALVFANTLRPNLRAKQSAAERAIELKMAVNRATEEQLLILDLIALNNLLYFEGPAGTGKTQILRHAAMQMKKDGRAVLYVCFNEMLADSLKAEIGKVAGITVMTLNELLLSIAGLKNNPKDAGTAWFDEDLPRKALLAVQSGKVHPEYHGICIDEFQDISSREEALLAVLGLASSLHRPYKVLMAADDRQQIYTSGAPVDSYRVAKSIFPNLTHVALNTNCRQAPKLSEAIHKLLSWPHSQLRHRLSVEEPGFLEVVDTTEERQGRDLAEVVSKLLKTYDANQIRILSPFSESHSLVGKLFQETETHSKSIRELKKLLKDPVSKKGKIPWRSTWKFKGLEDEVVILTDVSKASKSYWASLGKSLDNLVYVGLTRARSHAVLLVQDGLYANPKATKRS